jgi:hypothetical protein
MILRSQKVEIYLSFINLIQKPLNITFAQFAVFILTIREDPTPKSSALIPLA